MAGLVQTVLFLVLDLINFRSDLFVGYDETAVLLPDTRCTILFFGRVVQQNVVTGDVHLFVDLKFRIQPFLHVKLTLLDHAVGRSLKIVGQASFGHEIDKRLRQIEPSEFAGGIVERKSVVVVVKTLKRTILVSSKLVFSGSFSCLPSPTLKNETQMFSTARIFSL